MRGKFPGSTGINLNHANLQHFSYRPCRGGHAVEDSQLIASKYFRTLPEFYNAKENAKKWPWWITQNDSLRKIILGTYKGNSLPLPFTNSKRRTPDDDEDAEVHGRPGKSARRKQGTTGVKPDGQWNVNRHRSTGRRRWSSREDPS